MLNSSSLRRSSRGVHGGGMTNALSKMRSISREIHEQKRNSRENSMQKSVIQKPSENIQDALIGLKTMAEKREEQKLEQQEIETFRNMINENDKNMTASFSKDQFGGEVIEGPFVQKFTLEDLEAETGLRDGLDESNIDCDDDLEDIQRSHMIENNQNIDLDISNDNGLRDPNDRSLSLHQLEHSQYTYSKTNKSINQNEYEPNISCFEETQIHKMQQQIDSYQKIIAKQQETIRLGQSTSNESQVLDQIKEVLQSQNPNIDDLVQLSIDQDRKQYQSVQIEKDKQVLDILRSKDNQIAELTQNYEEAMDNVNKLMNDSPVQDLQLKIDQLLQDNKLKQAELDCNQLELSQFTVQVNDKELELIQLKAQNKVLEEQIYELQKISQDQFTKEISQLKQKLKNYESKSTFDTQRETFQDRNVQTDDDSFGKMQQQIDSLEKEKKETFAILSQTDVKIEGLQHSDLVKYSEYLKMQMKQTMVENMPSSTSISNFKEETDFVSQIVQENINLKLNMEKPQQFYALQIENRDRALKQVNDQLQYCQIQFKQEINNVLAGQQGEKPTDDSDHTELNQQFQELKIIMTKLWIKMEENNICEDQQSVKQEELQYMQESLKNASNTILQLSTQLWQQEQNLEQLPYLKNAAVKNKVLEVRQRLLKQQIQHLTTTLTSIINNQISQQSDQQVEVAALQNVVDEQQTKITQLNSQVEEKDKYINWYTESLKQQAEIQYDERLSDQDTRIQNYLQEIVIPNLNNNDQEAIELTKQFCDLQLQIDSVKQLNSQQQSQIKADSAKMDHLEKSILTMKFDEGMKVKVMQLEAKVLQKDKEIMQFKSEFEVSQFNQCLKKVDTLIQNISKTYNFTNHTELSGSMEMQAQIQSLQKQLIEMKSAQLLENEEIRTSCQVELIEEKKKIKDIQDIYIKKYQPLYQYDSPEALITLNEELNFQNNELQAKLETANNELEIIENKYENEKKQQLKLHDQIQAYKETVQDLKKDIVENSQYISTEESKIIMFDDMSQNFRQQQKHQNVSIDSHRSTLNSKRTMPVKGKKKTLDGRKSSLESDEQISVINPMVTNRSGYLPKLESNFTSFVPPKIVQQLIQAKMYEKQLKQEIKLCRTNEEKARNDLRKLLIDKEDGGSNDKQIIHELENQIREIEFQKLLKGDVQLDDDEQDATQFMEVSGNDYALLANTVIFLITQQSEEHQSVYKTIIIQLIKKINSLTGSTCSIDQFVPQDAKQQKLWFLQLLETQLKQAETMSQSLFDFVDRLQINIQGCLTAEAQIKATCMNLAKTTSEASEEIQLLKSITTLIKADLEHQTNVNTNSINPFIDTNSLDLKSQLNITNKVKSSLEADMVQLKKNLFETKNQYRTELEGLTKHNNVIERNLKKIEREVPKIKKENLALVKKVQTIEAENIELMSMAKSNSSGMEAKMLKPLNKKLQQSIKQIEVDRQKDQQKWWNEKQELMAKLKDIETVITTSRSRADDSDSGMLKTTLDQVQHENSEFYNLIEKQKAKILKLKNKVVGKDSIIKESDQQQREFQQQIGLLKQQAYEQKRLSMDQSTIALNDKELTLKHQDALIRDLENQITQLHQQNHLLQNESSQNSLQIQGELDNLRQNFSQCVQQVDQSQRSEHIYKQMISQLTTSIDGLENKVKVMNTKQSEEIGELQYNDQSLQMQINHLTTQNSQLKHDNKLLFEKVNISEQAIQNKDEELGITKAQLNEQTRTAQSIASQLEQSMIALQNMKQNLIKMEIDKDHMYQQLSQRVEETKASRTTLSETYEEQIKVLRALLDGKDTEIALKLTQNNKTLKKELAALKKAGKGVKKQEDDLMHEVLEDIDVQFDQLIMRARKFNELQEKMVEVQAHSSKTEGWNIVLVKQTAEQERTISQLKDEMDELIAKECQDGKLQKMLKQQSDQIKNYKQLAKTTDIELQQLKVSWVSPDRYKAELQQLKEFQAQTKHLKDEVTRKKELIQTLKTSKENAEKERAQTTMESLKMVEENQKLLKQAKSQLSQQSNLKQLKQDYEAAKDKLNTSNSDMLGLNDKIKLLKSDVQRKELIVKDLQSKLQKQNASIEHTTIDSQSNHNEDSDALKKRIKELKMKNKTDIDVKENQIRALKSKIESMQEIMNELQEQATEFAPVQMKDPNTDKYLKKEKQKVKKYEIIIQQSLLGILEISNLLQEVNQTISDDEKPKVLLGSGMSTEDKAFYQESVDILGMSMGELQQFIQPQQSENQQILDKFKNIQNENILEKDGDQLVIIGEVNKIITLCKNIINGK